MIIDIDIKIADSDGKLLQRLEKRFHNVDVTDDKLNFSLDIGKTFENFLSEYMSYSGRIIRERLINHDKATPITYETIDNYYQDATMQLNTNENMNLEDREIEYRIRIGNGNIFSGKFPFKQLIQISDAINVKKETDFPGTNEEVWDINTNMVKAIEKYEANFYQIQVDSEHAFMEPQLQS